MALNKLEGMAERGILMDLLKQICNVIIIGLRYYPVLLCVELKRKSKLCYFVTTLYVLLLFFSYIYMNIFCLLAASNAIKDVTSQYEGGVRGGLSLPGGGNALERPAADQLRMYRMMAHASTTPVTLLMSASGAGGVNRTAERLREELSTRAYLEVNKQRSGWLWTFFGKNFIKIVHAFARLGFVEK